MDVVIYQKAIANLIGNKVGFTFEETDYKTLVIFGDVKKPTEDEIKVEYDKVLVSENLVELRKQRNILLAETDYLALSDVTMSDAWKTYRQELRDITKTFKSMSDKDFKFPEKPTE
jgi:hypothetical protein